MKKRRKPNVDEHPQKVDENRTSNEIVEKSTKIKNQRKLIKNRRKSKIYEKCQIQSNVGENRRVDANPQINMKVERRRKSKKNTVAVVVAVEHRRQLKRRQKINKHRMSTEIDYIEYRRKSNVDEHQQKIDENRTSKKIVKKIGENRK